MVTTIRSVYCTAAAQRGCIGPPPPRSLLSQRFRKVDSGRLVRARCCDAVARRRVVYRHVIVDDDDSSSAARDRSPPHRSHVIVPPPARPVRANTIDGDTAHRCFAAPVPPRSLSAVTAITRGRRSRGINGKKPENPENLATDDDGPESGPGYGPGAIDCVGALSAATGALSVPHNRWPGPYYLPRCARQPVSLYTTRARYTRRRVHVASPSSCKTVNE